MELIPDELVKPGPGIHPCCEAKTTKGRQCRNRGYASVKVEGRRYGNAILCHVHYWMMVDEKGTP